MSDEWAIAHIYVIAKIENGRPCPPTKIGIAADPNKRLSTIKTNCPFPIDIIVAFGICQRKFISNFEAALHDRFKEHRLHGEWFDIDPLKAGAFIAQTMKDVILSSWEECGEEIKNGDFNVHDYFEMSGINQVIGDYAYMQEIRAANNKMSIA